MARKLTCWVESYLDFTKGLKSPTRYRKWAAIGTVAAALQRRVRVRIEGQFQFPNLYILLVGPPGIGKGNAVKPAARVTRKVQTIRLTPRGLTKRAFYKELEAAQRSEVNLETQRVTTHAAIAAVIEEFGVFLMPRDVEFMDALADVYDNPELWTYKTSSQGEDKAENPSFNMIACTTPRGLRERFTDDAFEMGLPARTTMIYADDVIHVPLFKERKSLPELEAALAHDLEQITLLKGDFRWTQEAATALEDWVVAGMKPKPQDPRFLHYCNRRLAHITKLCMVFSASRSDGLVIEAADLNDAKSSLLEAETVMPGAISALGGNPLKEQTRNALRFIEIEHANTKKPVPEFRLLRFLHDEVPLQYVGMVIESLINTARVSASGEPPTRLFYPMGRTKDAE